MEEDITFAFMTPIELIWILLIIWVGLHFCIKDNLGDLTKNYAEITATSGGFTKSQYNKFIDDLKVIGFDPENTEIKITAMATDGTDISEKAINVTPKENASTSTSNFCPRGTIITLDVISKKSSPLANIFSYLGDTSNLSLGTSHRVYMSERME